MVSLLRTTLLSLLFVGISTTIFAQEPLNPRLEGKYWSLGIGIPITTVRDKAHTPLAYRGMHFKVYTAFENVYSNGVLRTQLSLNFGNLKPYVKSKRARGTKASLTDLKLVSSYYHSINAAEDGLSEQFVGGGIAWQLNTRSYSLPSNNTTGFLASVALQVNMMDRRQAFDRTEWSATTTLALPLFARIFRPTYIGLPEMINEQKPGFKSVMREMKWVTLNRFFYLDAAVDFDRAVKSWRSQQFGYAWNLLHTSVPTYKPLTSVTGGLSYGFRYLN